MSEKKKTGKPFKSAGKTSGATGAGGVNWPEVNRVLDFMAEHGLEEFEFGNSDLRIRLKRPGAQQGWVPMAASTGVSAAAPAATPTATPARTAAAPSAAPEAAPAEDLHVIKSPIVGTYYAAANPESAPFVKVGDQVKTGQVLCIIEAMKLMNEIESDVSGEIVKIFPENGHPVEYGESLFAIREK